MHEWVKGCETSDEVLLIEITVYPYSSNFLHISGGLDLIIMPGLAFSDQGARLGRGKGFYDTYIEKCERLQGKRPYLLAVAFNEQLVEDVPMSDHDCLMDQVICAEQQSWIIFKSISMDGRPWS